MFSINKLFDYYGRQLKQKTTPMRKRLRMRIQLGCRKNKRVKNEEKLVFLGLNE